MNSIKDMELKDKRVLLRADFNVTIEDNGEIGDDSRIKATLPTIQYILDHDAKQLIIMSHLGEPEGKVVDKLKMDKVSERLIKLLEKSVYKTNDCIVGRMPTDGIILLENLRFHKEETDNDEEFAKSLASYADIYVNDAFGVSHRAHASLHAITKFLPSCIGLLMEKELENLNIDKMKKPIFALLGGAKLKTKIPLVQRMLVKADKVLLGGGMIFTFYAAEKLEIGESLFDKDYVVNAKMMLNNENLFLPEDVVIADCQTKETDIRTVSYKEIPPKSIGLDIGEKSVERFKGMLKDAATIIWNGPLGYYEKPPFDKATNEIAKFIADLDCIKIAGGGDTSDVIRNLGLESRFTFISSGGGAALEVLSGKGLVALKAMEENTAVDSNNTNNTNNN
jgi:phosphoglycerate kinase